MCLLKTAKKKMKPNEDFKKFCLTKGLDLEVFCYAAFQYFLFAIQLNKINKLLTLGRPWIGVFRFYDANGE